MSVTHSHAIFHPEISAPDWFRVSLLPSEECATAIRGILTAAEGILAQAENQIEDMREHIFNVRMCAFRIVSERELWKLDIDPEYGIPYRSMARWMAVLYPNEKGLRYAQLANATQKALPAVSIIDLGQMKQCNAVLLAKSSDTCQKDAAVRDAAKTASEKDFRATLNREHGQCHEEAETLEFVLSVSDAVIAKRILSEYGEQWNEQTLSAQLMGVLIDWDSGGHNEK
jgi:hypothetical protein